MKCAELQELPDLGLDEKNVLYFYFKIDSIFPLQDEGKISLSMKSVNQTNGKDLDPNNIQLR